MELIRRYAPYLVDRYGEKTYRVAVDAGFTCPVRESGEPCTYCDSTGSRAPYLGDRAAIRSQIERGIEFLSSRYGASRFLLYFQAFSNTYADVKTLRRVYDEGLSAATFAGLVVATRPDCIDRPRAELLVSYLDRGYDVWVELGLQSASDETLRRIKRGHDRKSFEEAVDLLRQLGISVAAHLILGLPGETEENVAESARFISTRGVDGVKFHNLVLISGTEMFRQYQSGDIEPVSSERYLRLLVAAVEHLRREVIVMRLTCDPIRGVEHVPAEFPDKSTLYRLLKQTMAEQSTYQGRCWTDNDEQLYKEAKDRQCK